MKCLVSIESRLGLEGKLWEKLENYSVQEKRHNIFMQKDGHFGVFSVCSGMLCCHSASIGTLCVWCTVCISLSLAVCGPVFYADCPWGDNGRILHSGAVGGRGQKSQ